MDRCFFDGNCLEVIWSIARPFLYFIVGPIIAVLGLIWYAIIAGKKGEKNPAI